MKIKHHNPRKNPKNRGFLLLEALLGFMIFATSVVGILIALNKAMELSTEVRREQWAMQQARNIVIEIATMPSSADEFAREEVRVIDEGAEARILVTPYEAVNQEEENLEDLYEITVTIRREIGSGKWKETEHKLLHYSRLFEGSSGGGARGDSGGPRRAR